MLRLNVAWIKLKSVLFLVEVESPGLLALIKAIEMETAGSSYLFQLVLGLVAF